MSLHDPHTPRNPPFPALFVDAMWLENHLNGPDMRIIQVGGEKYYPQFHVPGASLLSYKSLVTQRDSVPGVRADLPVLSDLFGPLGIGMETPVLAYDLSGGMDAARLVWTLRSLGHTANAMLDGGFGLWYKEKRPIDHAIPPVSPRPFVPNPTSDWEVEAEEVLALCQPGQDTVLLDTRTPNEYHGRVLKGPRGHLAGARHLDWVTTLRHNNDPRIKERAELLALFADAGVETPAQRVVLYCETGHRASQVWLLLRHLGFPHVRLYDGSIAEWRVRGYPVTLA